MRAARALPSVFWLAAALSGVAATYAVSRLLTVGFGEAHDLYASFLPQAVYAAESVLVGGRGVFWNAFQNCGQPFFAPGRTGLLYPPHWLFLLLEPGIALTVVIALHSVIGGVGLYALARQLGAGPAAAACGMLVFQLGTTLRVLATLATPHLSAYAWLPAVLLATERLLAAPGAARAVLLAAVLAVQWLPGSPQVWLLTLQLMGLRVLWALVAGAPGGRVRTAAWLSVGLLLVPLLGGVQMLPDAEAMRASASSGKQEAGEADAHAVMRRAEVERELGLRGMHHRALVPALVPLVVVGGLTAGSAGVFYAGVGLLYGILAFGPATPLFSWYLAVPGADPFRAASGLLWVTGFCFALLSALGVDGVTRARGGRLARFQVVLVLGALGLGLVVIEGWVPGGLGWGERALAAAVVLAAVTAAWMPALRSFAQVVLLVSVGILLVAIPGSNARVLLPEPPLYEGRRALLEEMRELVSSQQRIYVVNRRGTFRDFSLVPKTPSLARLRSSVDDGLPLSARYVRYAARMRAGRNPASPEQADRMPELGPQYSRPLLDLTATRYVLVDVREASELEKMPTLARRLTRDQTLVLENPSALPRAFWVSRVEVIADPERLLDRLAAGADDLRRVAFLESPPPSGFSGAPADVTPDAVRFVHDDPEYVELLVDAPAHGFLVLSDQDDGGWRASVRGKPVSVLRANYVFRAVEVPGGRSTVTFRYRPPGLLAGGLLTAMGLFVGAGLVLRERRHAAATSQDALA